MSRTRTVGPVVLLLLATILAGCQTVKNPFFTMSSDSPVPYFGGDVLALAWLYVSVRVVCWAPAKWQLAGALAGACALELGQAWGLVEKLGLGDSTVARVVLGATWDPWDIAAYCTGAGLVWAWERARGEAI